MAESEMDRRQAVDETLAVALAAGQSHREAGDLAGVGAKTVQRRLQDPAFAQRVAVARAARHAEISGALLGAASRAVTTLVDLLDDDDTKVRLAAARELLTSSGRFVNQADVLARLQSLEEALGS